VKWGISKKKAEMVEKEGDKRRRMEHKRRQGLMFQA
jgi:hypothetical protein